MESCSITPPTEISKIIVDKVYDTYCNSLVSEATVDFEDIDYYRDFDSPTLEPITSDATFVECLSIDMTNYNYTVAEDIVTVSCDVKCIHRVPLDAGGYEYASQTTEITNSFQVDIPPVNNLRRSNTLTRANDSNLLVQIFTEELNSYISKRDAVNNVVETTSCIGMFYLFTIEEEVQLLIPSYGYAPKPPQCTLDSCPEEYIPDWPPGPKD